MKYENGHRELQKRLRFERALAELSAKFVRLQTHEVDREIENSLRLIVEVLDVDRCSLAQFSEDMSELPVTHTFSIPGVRLLSAALLNRELPYYTSRIRAGNILAISNIDDLPELAHIDKIWLQQHNTKSSLVIPLNVGDSTLGLIGLATTREKRIWNQDLIQRIKLAGEVFANALMRKRNEQKLHQAIEHIRLLNDQLEAENIYLKDKIEHSSRFQEIVGQSSAIRFAFSQVEKVAGTESTVLLLGETGTGKELFAKAIHTLSNRNKRTMVKVNCAAIPSTLIETELFGREKGAYTGALTKQIGRFEMANGSTLFLDEISEMSIELQSKLLRVLQEKQFERVGGTRTINVDVRIIAATNQDLLEAVQKGTFRQDLFYRLNVFPISIPPLRDRLDDIPLLVQHFLNELGETMAKKFKRISLKSLNALVRYSWPGNIRELRNVVERAMIMNSGPTIQIRPPQSESAGSSAISLQLDDVIRNHITNVLSMTGWKVSGKQGAAALLGVPATTLESKMKKLGIKRSQRLGERLISMSHGIS